MEDLACQVVDPDDGVEMMLHCLDPFPFVVLKARH